MRDARLPRPLVNQQVVDLGGRLLGVPDLLDPQAGLVAEYDGAGHRELGRHTADNVREEGLEDSGLVVVRATGPDLAAERRRLAVRLRRGWQRGVARDRRRDRWRLG